MEKISPTRTRRIDLTQLNPEFSGIGKKLNKSHLVRKQTEKQKQSMVGRVSFLRKEEDLAEKMVMKKQKELQTLMSVIARKQADSVEREERRRAKEEAMAMQREQNMRRRSEHQDKIRNAFLSLYDEHQQNVNTMRQTSQRHEEMKKSFQKEMLRGKHEKVFRVSKDKDEGKQRIKGFMKDRVDSFTSRYKQQITGEEEQTRKLSGEVKECCEEEGHLRLRLQNSSSRIQALNEEILKATLDSRVRLGNRSWNWPINKNQYSLDTKQQSSNYADLKLDKLIERQLSISDSDS